MYYVCTPNYDYETLVWCWEGLRLDVDIGVELPVIIIIYIDIELIGYDMIGLIVIKY